MPHAGINGQRLYYEVGGEGETVILLHGFLANADIMEAPATGLASGFRAVRLDRRGCGRSSPSEGPVPLAVEAEDIRALLDWYSVSATHFLAHDDGAEVALEFALTHPNRTLSIALLAPSLDGFPLSPEGASARAELLAAVRENPKRALEERFFPSSLFDAAREREGMIDRLSEIFRRFPPAPGRFEREERPAPPHARRLGEIRSRCAILVGDRDERDRLLAAETLADGIAGSELITFPGLCRFLHVEESRSVMRRLTDFFLPEPVIER